MKPLHISLDTAHSACKPSSFIIILHTFIPSLPPSTRTSHPCHHHISTGRRPIISVLTFHMPQNYPYNTVTIQNLGSQPHTILFSGLLQDQQKQHVCVRTFRFQYTWCKLLHIISCELVDILVWDLLSSNWDFELFDVACFGKVSLQNYVMLKEVNPSMTKCYRGRVQ